MGGAFGGLIHDVVTVFRFSSAVRALKSSSCSRALDRKSLIDFSMAAASSGFSCSHSLMTLTVLAYRTRAAAPSRLGDLLGVAIL